MKSFRSFLTILWSIENHPFSNIDFDDPQCLPKDECFSVKISLYGMTHSPLGGKIYALGGYNGRTRMSSGERYEPQRNQWEMIPPMHRQRSDASAAALQNKIYIVGGFSGREVLNSAEVFDVETNQWSYIHPMINPRSGVSLVAFRDSLYALGGFNGFIRLSSGNLVNF